MAQADGALERRKMARASRTTTATSEKVTSRYGLYWLGFSSMAAKLRDSPAAVSIDRSQGAYPGRVILMECLPGLSLMRLGVLPT